ncbi:MAG: ASKHA domain-containing protein [Desulfobacteraceae bacterium]|nr:ASKHA domain-containing protein [Desulfobacteraceae bacterium]
MQGLFDPAARLVNLSLSTPSLSDNKSIDTRIRAAVQELLGERPVLPYRALSGLTSRIYRQTRFGVVLVDGQCGLEVADIGPADRMRSPFGLAVDLGSTSVVFYLVEMATGNVISTTSRPNPQRVHGEDILERIVFSRGSRGLETLKGELSGLFNEVTAEITNEAGLSPEDIFFISVAGNTTMTHFFLGLDPGHICVEPYLPLANSFDLIMAKELGIRSHPGARVYCFPNVSSYFGGDLLAGILATGIHMREEISMLVDVGTNAEVVLGNRDWMVACAGAAGPALEGGILSCGMMAAPGAIERVGIDMPGLTPRYQTIGAVPPIGMCGSGIIDLIAALFKAGLVDRTGKFVLDRDAGRMRQIDGEWAYVLVKEEETGHGRPVYISQSDIKNLIRSKAAMYTILNVVIQSVGIDFDDIGSFYVAGAFGNYIDPQNAVTIGMLPDVPVERFKGVGNTAGMGAIEVLRNRRARLDVEDIRDHVTYLEMNVRADFMNQLTASLFLPHTDIARFPSVKAFLEHSRA